MASGGERNFQLANYTDVQIIHSAVEQYEDALGNFRLRWKDNSEEAHFKVQGFVADYSLPCGITPRDHINPGLDFQHITLTGHESSEFYCAVEAVEAFNQYFQCSFSQGYVQPMDESSVGTLPAITFKTRYFTLRSGQSVDSAVDLPPEMDPRGLLSEKIKHSSYFYFSEDNLVQYMMQQKQGDYLDDNVIVTSVDRSSPVRIRSGILVELDVVFLLVKTRNFKMKLVPSYRSVTILDDGFAFELRTKRKRSSTDD